MLPFEALKANLFENRAGCRFFSDEELSHLLDEWAGDIAAASYAGCLKKAEADGVTLPDGSRTADTRAYWLSLARFYRASATGCIARGDEVGM